MPHNILTSLLVSFHIIPIIACAYLACSQIFSPPPPSPLTPCFHEFLHSLLFSCRVQQHNYPGLRSLYHLLCPLVLFLVMLMYCCIKIMMLPRRGGGLVVQWGRKHTAALSAATMFGFLPHLYPSSPFFLKKMLLNVILPFFSCLYPHSVLIL